MGGAVIWNVDSRVWDIDPFSNELNQQLRISNHASATMRLGNHASATMRFSNQSDRCSNQTARFSNPRVCSTEAFVKKRWTQILAKRGRLGRANACKTWTLAVKSNKHGIAHCVFECIWHEKSYKGHGVQSVRLFLVSSWAFSISLREVMFIRGNCSSRRCCQFSELKKVVPKWPQNRSSRGANLLQGLHRVSWSILCSEHVIFCERGRV